MYANHLQKSKKKLIFMCIGYTQYSIYKTECLLVCIRMCESLYWNWLLTQKKNKCFFSLFYLWTMVSMMRTSGILSFEWEIKERFALRHMMITWLDKIIGHVKSKAHTTHIYLQKKTEQTMKKKIAGFELRKLKLIKKYIQNWEKVDVVYEIPVSFFSFMFLFGKRPSKYWNWSIPYHDCS